MNVVVAEDLPLGHFDEVLIELVLVNLLDNAIKYSPAGTAIEVRAEQAPGAVAIEVDDRGRGFLPGDEQQVWPVEVEAEAAAAGHQAGRVAIGRGEQIGDQILSSARLLPDFAGGSDLVGLQVFVRCERVATLHYSRQRCIDVVCGASDHVS